MTIGLTFRQLVSVFGECLDIRRNEFITEILMAKEGFNPTTKQLLNEYRKAYPELTDKQIAIYFTNVMAMLDTIARNNEVISKSISP